MIQEKDFPEGVPSPGGGTFEGPGGMAPAFAPGGPLDPTSPVLTEQYFQQVQEGAIQQGAFQPGFVGSGAPGDPMLGAGAPFSTPYPTSSIAAVGGSGAGSTVYPTPSDPNQGIQGLPGHGTTPGRFQPGGGVHLPSTGQLPSQRPGTGRDPGFLARIVPVSGDVSRIIPVSGTGGPETQPPTVGGGPVMPPNRPGQRPPNPDLPPGTVEPPIVIPPGEGGGPTFGKPKGLKVLPMPKDKQPPTTPPKPPGQWVTVDAGRGHPPAWAFLEDSSTGGDSGLEPTPKPAGIAGTLPGTKPTPQDRGHYIPVLLPYDVEPVSLQDEPIWAWVPTIDHTYGVKEEDKPQPK